MRTLFAGMVAGLLALCGTAQAATFTNGSFEIGPDPGSFSPKAAADATIAGWTVNGPGGVDYIGTYWQASDGARSIDLNNLAPGGMSQTFDTVAGEQYDVLFDMAGNPDGGPVIKTLDVNVGAFTQSYAFDSTGATPAAMGWVTNLFTFTATGASSTLTFTSTTIGASGNPIFPFAFGPALDNVRVMSNVPEPATLAIWGVLGLAGAATRRFRRRQAK